jgi:hypothetical protein
MAKVWVLIAGKSKKFAVLGADDVYMPWLVSK